jgi:dolichol-phosphate mannosyltransferase
VAEVPIHFADRQFGESKLSFKEQLKYLQHVRRLVMHKYPNWSYMLQFAVVGASGLVVNLAVLTLCLAASWSFALASGLGVGVSVVTNFFLNRRFTFHHAARGPIVRQFLGFVASCAVGAIVNYLVANACHRSFGDSWPPQLSASVGVLAGMAFNFVLNRYIVFRRTPEADLPK